MGNHYSLGFNCQGNGENIFYQEVQRLARRYRMNWVCVAKERSAALLKRADRGRLTINLFLNTEADGTSLINSQTLLLKSLKAHNCLVVEDADDMRIHADRALQLSYLKRASLPVPRYFILTARRGTSLAGAMARRIKDGSPWVARPAMGMNHTPLIINDSRDIPPDLSRATSQSERRILLYRYYKPRCMAHRVLSFRVWYLFGHVVPCWYQQGDQIPVMMKPEDIRLPFLPRLVNLVKRIAEITLLNWFVTDLVVPKGRGEECFIIQETANALAGLGPGVKRLNRVPHEVIRIAASRIVEVAWRKENNLPLQDGITVRLQA